MNAKEAREEAENAGKKHNTFDCLLQIKKAVRDGNLEVWMYQKEISAKAKLDLQSQGYKVGETQFDRNEVLTKISW